MEGADRFHERVTASPATRSELQTLEGRKCIEGEGLACLVFWDRRKTEFTQMGHGTKMDESAIIQSQNFYRVKRSPTAKMLRDCGDIYCWVGVEYNFFEKWTLWKQWREEVYYLLPHWLSVELEIQASNTWHKHEMFEWQNGWIGDQGMKFTERGVGHASSQCSHNISARPWIIHTQNSDSPSMEDKATAVGEFYGAYEAL
jgi:hypothetical protein